jgi:Tfp pilus assembly protein PilE
MNTSRQASGFTAVELLITLFVAAAFLIAAYQLFSLVIRDGGQIRSESRASNIAYDYLRRYSDSATTIPCTASTPLNNASITVSGLTNVKVTIDVSCPTGTIAGLSKVKATLTYNSPMQTVTYAAYVSPPDETGMRNITNRLVALWGFNGYTSLASLRSVGAK